MKFYSLHSAMLASIINFTYMLLLVKASVLKSKFATSVIIFFPNLGNFGVALSEHSDVSNIEL